MQENMTMTMQVILFVTDGNSNSNLYSIHSTAINRFLPGLVGVCNYCYVSKAGRRSQRKFFYLSTTSSFSELPLG